MGCAGVVHKKAVGFTNINDYLLILSETMEIPVK